MILGRRADNASKPPLERTVAQADVPREIVEPMAPGSPSEPGDRGGDERVEDDVSNATDKEILEQRDPLPMVVGAGDLIVKPVEFVGATKHGPRSTWYRKSRPSRDPEGSMGHRGAGKYRPALSERESPPSPVRRA